MATRLQTAALDRAADRAAEFLRAVAHPGRLRIICALIEGERSASDLARRAHLLAPALSQHAAVLESKGLIGRRREAKSVFYSLVAPEAAALAELLYKLFCQPPAAQPRRRSIARGKSA
jgi:DNA-binding transcriptional ArsR family regulator